MNVSLTDAFGDSIMRGSACLQACDFPDNAVAALATANPAQHATSLNYAVGGEAHSVSWTKAQANIPADKPQFSLWFVWSPNDGEANIQADYDTYIASFIALAKSVPNGVPVLFTSLPCSCITTVANDNVRLSVNAAVMAQASSSVIAVDMSALVTDGASPARIASADNLDGIHVNATGAALLQTALQNALQNYYNTH